MIKFPGKEKKKRSADWENLEIAVIHNQWNGWKWT